MAIEYEGRKLFFCYSTRDELIHTILMIIGEFFGEQHDGLEVKGRDVVDVGAYFGDSAIKFALRNARHVYAFEPYPYSYRIARKNIELNRLEDCVKLINAGCGPKDRVYRISKSYRNLAGSDMKSTGRGKQINVYSLDTIVRRYRLRNAVMKIDCEGCEYGVLLNASSKTIRSFSSILIEYHYGYERLEKLLGREGFNIKHVLDEGKTRNANVRNQKMNQGIILAKR